MSEKRIVTQYAVSLPALWCTPGGTDLHAVTVGLSTLGIRLRSAALPKPGAKVICRIRDVGSMEAQVQRVGACDFDLAVIGRDPSPGDVARRLLSLSRQPTQQVDLVRVARRFVLSQQAVRVVLDDGTDVPATIVNLSALGVALQLDVPLTLGQSITVGRRRATVARHIVNGVGAAFAEPFEEGSVSEHTVL